MLRSRRGLSIPAVMVAAGMASVVALIVSSISKQIFNTQKSVQITFAESELLAKIETNLASTTACNNTLSQATSPMTSAQTLNNIYNKKNEVILTTSVPIENGMLEIDSFSLQPSSFTPSGTNKSGNVTLVVGIKRLSKSFQGIKKVNRKVVLNVTIDSSDAFVECRNSAANAEIDTIVAEARRLACTDLGGTYDATATPSCALANRGPASSPGSAKATVLKIDTSSYVALVDGQVYNWGLSTGTGYTDPPSASELSNVEKLFSNGSTAVALHDDGSITCWGLSISGGDCSSASSLTGVVDIVSTGTAYAALGGDGTITCWGMSNSGGDCSSLYSLTDIVKVVKILSGGMAALRENGIVVVWGGNPPSNYPHTSTAGALTGNKDLVSNGYAYAVIKNGGTVAAWGRSGYGGRIPSNKVGQLIGITTIFPLSTGGFRAFKSDGTSVCWDRGC